jgi:hypothetical protein
MSAPLLRWAINHDTLTAPPGVVKPIEAEKPQAQPQSQCYQRLRRFLVKGESQLVLGFMQVAACLLIDRTLLTFSG